MKGLRTLLIAGAAFLSCEVTLPPIRALAIRFGACDPLGPLKIHTKPIPRMGGVAMLAGLLAGFAVGYRWFGLRFATGLWLGLAIIFAVGLIDDLLEISPGLRLLAQAVAAAAVCWDGTRSISVHLPALGFVIECIFVIAFINAFNFLDGADGIAAGTSATLAMGFVLVGKTNAVVLTAAALLGSCLGFLVFNFPPASIFMGDCGSTTLGLLVAFLSLQFCRSLPAVDYRYIVPLLFAAVPLLDMVYAVMRRVGGKTSVTQGDRRHCFDLLLRRGWPPRTVGLCCFCATAVTVSLGWSCLGRGPTYTFWIAALIVAIISLIAFELGSLQGEATSLQPAQEKPGQASCESLFQIARNTRRK